MRFRDTRPERKEKDTPAALGLLFSHPGFMPHGVSFAPAKRKRIGRGGTVVRVDGVDLDNRATKYRAEDGPTGLAFVGWRKKRRERHGARFATKGIGGTREDRRLMRNARKQERRAAR